jgi:hypothetical protein
VLLTSAKSCQILSAAIYIRRPGYTYVLRAIIPFSEVGPMKLAGPDVVVAGTTNQLPCCYPCELASCHLASHAAG